MITTQSITLSPVGGLLTKTGARPALQRVQVSGSLSGPLLDLTVDQQFINDSDDSAEICYTFPLPWGAVLLSLEVRLGDRLLDGQVLPQSQATARYESAIDDGHAAVMLQQADDGTCTLNLGNLAPGEACRVNYRFTQVLRITQNSLRLMLPTVIAPRYGAPDSIMAPSPVLRVAHPDVLAEYPFELELTLHGSLSAGVIGSPSHPIAVAVHDDFARVTLSRRGYLDRDFVLVVDALPQTSSVLLGPDPVHAGQVVGLASFALPQSTAQAAVTVKFLIDCSGSMAGDSIAAAREAVANCLAQMRPDDRFSLSAFGDCVQHLAPRLMDVRPATMTSARRWLTQLNANLGGTAMQQALTRIFSIGSGEEADVLLVTDGQIEALRATVAAAQRGRQRVFAVGIGAAPVEALLRQLVDATGGACEFVSAGEDAAPAIRRLFARLRAARPQAARCAWDDQPIWATDAAVHPVMPGDTLQLFARFGRQPQGQATLSWTDRSGSFQRMATVPLSMDAGDAIARLAAAEQIKGLPEAEAMALAVQYRLLTPHTCWVMVHQRAEDERAQSLPGLIQVRPMLPAGWAGSSSVDSSSMLSTVEPVVHYRSVGAPDVRWRSSRSNVGVQQIEALPDGGMAEIEIPAFVRKQADAGKGPFAFLSRIDDDKRSLQIRFILLRTAHDWLWRQPMEAWPSVIAELEALDVPIGIRMWLQRQINPMAPEASVVHIFLLAVALHILWGDPEGHDVLRHAGLTLHDEVVLQAVFDELFESPPLAAVASCVLGLDDQNLARFEQACLSTAAPESAA